jgi:flotillin
MVIAQLPEMLRAAAQGLQGANVTVLDGAEGLNSVVASLVAQGSAMLETIRAGLRTTPLNGNRVEGRPIV